ncbi:3-dehydroquinate dehydratase [Phaeobacter gallaeciensis]|uniref:3-dehydroquinate dehydratase n=1 Tax=Phaeobacter gallaeciensis TaxID=60890 RepID=A0A366X613_9RHOB|nr:MULTISPECIES: DUF2478 domain-containing protein [Roseobacteraceae]MBT8167019.1 DUF2478 domain-containing protein [Falsiruegeria litorea]RBW57367.1 3-dehydroquinate dehydratase [Phaeobacter gallaeciensis]
MHLAYVTTEARGGTDRLLSAIAERLESKGVTLAGVVQTNTECADDTKCDMDLRVLANGEKIRISQSLGAGSRGCRLDPAALETSVALVLETLEKTPRLLIINKFGKHEADGRGFRPVIGDALMRGIPVLVGVNGLNEQKFLDFTEGAAEKMEADLDAIEAWLDRVAPEGSEAA